MEENQAVLISTIVDADDPRKKQGKSKFKSIITIVAAICVLCVVQYEGIQILKDSLVKAVTPFVYETLHQRALERFDQQEQQRGTSFFDYHTESESFSQVNERRVRQLRRTCERLKSEESYSFLTTKLEEFDANTQDSRKFARAFDVTENIKLPKDPGYVEYFDRFVNVFRHDNDWSICLPPKHATSNIYRLIIAGKRGQNPDEITWDDNLYNTVPNILNWKNSIRVALSKLRNSPSKIIAVRHPLEALFSAWKDKFRVNDEHYDNYKKYLEDIPRNYVPDDPEYEVSFADFIHYWLNAFEGTGHSGEKWFNGHWRTQTYNCLPCSVDYNYIVKTETISRDSPELLKVLMTEDMAAGKGSTDEIAIMPKYQFYSNDMNDAHKQKKTEHVDRFAKHKWLPEDSKMRLYEIFKHECEMFDYDFFSFFPDQDSEEQSETRLKRSQP